MKIPNKIKIGACIIIIERRPHREIDSECNGGWAMWEENKLILADDMPEDREAVTFLHEILHFINIYLEEKEATFISEGLMQVIRDNGIEFTKK